MQLLLHVKQKNPLITLVLLKNIMLIDRRCHAAIEAELAQKPLAETKQQEKELVRYINKLTKDGLPPTNSIVGTFTSRIAKEQPGKLWVSRFIKRLRQAQICLLRGLGLSRKRAANTCLIYHYFKLVCIGSLLRFYTNIVKD